MRRFTLITVLLIACCCAEGVAQEFFKKPLKASKHAQSGLSPYNIGVKFSCPWNTMAISYLNDTRHLGLFGYAIGITGERNFNKISIGLESTFAQKGTRMENTKLFQTSLDDDPPTGTLVSRYYLAYNVITIRIPITWYLQGILSNDNFIPYLYAGPEIDIPSPFNILFVDGGFKIGDPYNIIRRRENNGPAVTTLGNTTPVFNTSAVLGLGIMLKLPTESSTLFFKFDAAFNYGIRNLSATVDEKIHAHDLEVNATILFPIKKRLHDACYSFR